MKNNLNIIFLTTLILGTLISVSSSNWLGIWIGLELNMLSFIPLVVSYNNSNSGETSLKYFLVQAVASIIFITAALSNTLFFTLFNNFNLINFSFFFLNLSLLLKLGAAPFQMWFISIMNGLSWLNCWILMTWQKIVPLSIMMYLTFNQKFIFISSLASVLIGSIGGLNQTYLKKIFGFSSVNHLGWMFASLLLKKSLFLIYFLIYMFMNFVIILIVKTFNLLVINQTFLSNTSWPFMFNLLSLGGLPPFLGFLPKFLILQNLLYVNNLFLPLVLTMTALITLFYYLRLIYMSFLLSSFSLNPLLSTLVSPSLLMVCLNMMTIFGLLLWNLF